VSQSPLVDVEKMSDNEKNSAYSTRNGRDLESNAFAPEPPTASEQWLMLLSHIVRTFGIGFALIINLIVYVPFFIFGILPVLIKKRFGNSSNSDYPYLAPRIPNRVPPVHPIPIFFSQGQSHCELSSADISPLLLSCNSDANNIPGLGNDFGICSDDPKYFPSLTPPAYDSLGPIDRPFIRHVRTTQTPQPYLMCKDCGSKDVEHCAESHLTVEDESVDGGLTMKETRAVDSLEGTPRYGAGLASGMMIPGSSRVEEGNYVLQRTKTWENVQHAMCSSFKQL
jgi:hypothetical protein